MTDNAKIVLAVVTALFLIAVVALSLAAITSADSTESMITLAATATGALGSILTNILRTSRVETQTDSHESPSVRS